MLIRLQSAFFAFVRRWDRNALVIKILGLTRREGFGEQPALLIVQIDGFSRSQLEAALSNGRMPFLGGLVNREGYEMKTFYSGLPSTTPAVQAELFYGVPAAVPAFEFRDRDAGEAVVMYEPKRAREVEDLLAKEARGLLEGGSSWSNIYRGGAEPAECHFCFSALGQDRSRQWGDFIRHAVAGLIYIPTFLWLAGRTLGEFGLAIGEALGGILRGKAALEEMGMVLSRTCLGMGVRELVALGAQLDLDRGLPIVHVNFVGYDESAHRRGPGSAFAHRSLAGIDRAIRTLSRHAFRSRRADYQVWIFSDHGQEATKPFAEGVAGGLEKILEDELGPADQGGYSVHAMGPVGHLYLHRPIGDGGLSALAGRLARDGHLPGVLIRTPSGGIRWYHGNEETPVPEGVPGLLGGHPVALREEIARDLESLCRHRNAGDLILLGWSPDRQAMSFVQERGAHAGPGPDETQGFLLLPRGTSLPPGAEDFVRASALREAALYALGRSASGLPRAAPSSGSGFRVMTYNVHRCEGSDGRISPRRIGRIIGQLRPDIVALQELDCGQSRTRGEDQAKEIADLLGYHVMFCPTVQCADKHYGHAILTREKPELVKVGRLPSATKSIWPEPRSAIWVRVRVEGVVVNVVATHLGLNARERGVQIRKLLGRSWLGGCDPTEPVIFCGDMNFRPGSPAHHAVKSRLFDCVDHLRTPLPTFPAFRPIVRLDHIFVSQAITVDRVVAVRTPFTRIASDHLPVVADLKFSPTA